jgi:hypothetical protein
MATKPGEPYLNGRDAPSQRRLYGVELGDGTVAQAAREVQAAIRKASPWLQV